MATDIGTPYVPKTPLDGSNATAALNFFTAVALSNAVPTYSNQFWLVDEDDALVEDITPYVVMNGDSKPSVKHDCTLDGVQTTLTFTYRRPTELQWGYDRVKCFLLARCDGVSGGQWYRFPRGVFIVTSPSRDLQDSIEREVSGYDKSYLLMSDQKDSMSWNSGTLYKDAIADCFIAAGLIGSRTDFFHPFVSYSSAWASKPIPAGQFRSFALSGSAQSLLSIVNSLLKDSGQQSLFQDFNGIFQIADLPTPGDDPLAWTWVANQGATITEGDYLAKVVLRDNRTYNGDVYNQPNQFVFIDTNLTFTPTHTDGSDGMYLVNNTTTSPSDQNSVGRVIRHTEFVDASGTADLIAQGNAFVQNALGAIETVSLTTAPWCVGWHYDVFLYADAALPVAPTRRLQVQSWELPLTGEPMQWETNVVSTR